MQEHCECCWYGWKKKVKPRNELDGVWHHCDGSKKAEKAWILQNMDGTQVKKGLMNIADGVWVRTLWTWSCCALWTWSLLCRRQNLVPRLMNVVAHYHNTWKLTWKSRISLSNEWYNKHRMKRVLYCTELKFESESRADDAQRQEVWNRRHCLWGKMRLP